MLCHVYHAVGLMSLLRLQAQYLFRGDSIPKGGQSEQGRSVPWTDQDQRFCFGMLI